MSEYDFTRLSNSGFERLSCDVLNAELGLRLETYPEGRDGGVDLRDIRADGTIIVGQCKHYERSGRATFMRAVEKEKDKPGRKQAGRYLFTTTFRLTAAAQVEVANILEIPESDVWGPAKINDALRRHPDIVKSHYALWLSSTATLERILHAELWNRTEYLLEQIADEARFWVETPAFSEARYLLDTYGVCIISGLPGTGKTFLLNRLALDAVAQQEWQVLDIRKPDEAWKLWKPEVKQLFCFNDFLGETRLDRDIVDQGSMLLDFIKRVRRDRADNRDDTRLVMTTRAQLLRGAAHSDSEALADIAAHPARCGVDLMAFDNRTRREILAVHLSLSHLPDDERERACVSRRLLSLAENPSYSPRLIQKVTERARDTDTGDAILQDLGRTFANPQELWRTSFSPLSADAKETLLTLATLPPRPIELRNLRALARFAGPTTEWHSRVIYTLEPTWIRLTDSENAKNVRFSNPSCRDYLLNMLDDPEHAEDRLARLDRMDQLLNLTYESGLVMLDGGRSAGPERPHLANALTRHGTQLCSRIEDWTEEAVDRNLSIANTLTWLADAASLLAIFGHPESNTWLLTRVNDQLRSVPSLPPYPAIVLARRLAKVAFSDSVLPAEAVEQLVLAAIRASTTSRDLLSYEALPNNFRTENTEALARQQAERIFATELEILMVSNNGPEEALSEGEELQQRAARYGLDLDLDDLLDTLPGVDR
ncbi:restriction endonuclease [Nocardia jiangxiensis]|uniref:Restriction endonuclease n=1 Tax=Nocardia jiangxiensis TaxID=282685 RepID=A0ABW6S9D1_9NOCA